MRYRQEEKVVMEEREAQERQAFADERKKWV